MLDVVGPDQLVVIANTADDVEIYGGYVSPDPDLITFWLADQIHERGWGLVGDTFHVMDGLRELGLEVWFNLGDRDLAIALERARRLKAGQRLTDAQAAVASAVGARASVLPMSDQPVRTLVYAQGRRWPFQEFMIKGQSRGPIAEVEFRGSRSALATAEALDAIGKARAILIGPSNPVVSIGPMLAIADLRAALKEASAPVVAVSPIVRGKVLKGPTEAFMDWAGQPLTSTGIAATYAGLIDGLVADEPTDAVPVLETDVLLDSDEARRRTAEDTLRFALGLG
jgi:LPPG:FO 2-phospho-L-lactate transferase